MKGAALALVLILAGAAVWSAAATQPGLWADEIFSLAIATGHSLEHPAARADPALGDFVESRGPQSPAALRRYAEHDTPAAGPGRIVRAVLLSDTNPPLYYLLLHPWTRIFGTGDAALRLFSTWWALLSLPLLWLVGRELDGESAAWSACVLFAWSPLAVYYSAEGRMYSLLWFLALSLAWLALRVSRPDGRRRIAALWVLAGVAGLLTHYFFAFVWLACAGWLWLRAPKTRRRAVTALGAVTLLAVLPWYLEVPASLARWRVTGGWLDGELRWPRALGRPFALAGSLLSGSSYLGGWRHADAALGALLLLLLILLVRGGAVRRLFSGDRLLLWGWLAAACFGPLVFDLLRHTTTSDIPRYVLSALPAALLLAAIALNQLPPGLHLALLGAVLLAWLPGSRAVVTSRTPRPWEPYREVAARLDSWAGPGDLVLVSSIPSGIIGVARYLKGDLPLTPWVGRLGNRQVPGDLEPLLRGRRRVAYVRIHDLGAPRSAEEWLLAHARLVDRVGFRSSRAEVMYFEPAAGEFIVAQDSPLADGPQSPPR